uniref:Uncharacterized protein n=1 Tax=Aegilops tauschii subsp. strangulata TaxID=200361 RepID=A0A453LF24_AEGTS
PYRCSPSSHAQVRRRPSSSLPLLCAVVPLPLCAAGHLPLCSAAPLQLSRAAVPLPLCAASPFPLCGAGPLPLCAAAPLQLFRDADPCPSHSRAAGPSPSLFVLHSPPSIHFLTPHLICRLEGEESRV